MSKVGRPELFEEKVWYNLIIPKSLKGDKEFYKYMRNCRDNYISGKIKENIDSEIIKKFIPGFLESDYDFPLTDKEQARIKELYEVMK